MDFNFWDGWRGYMYDNEQLRTPRWGGWTWYNAVEPNLYDFIHFKWFDEQLENNNKITEEIYVST